MVSFLVRLALERPTDKSGTFAILLLQTLDEEMILQAALLADAADECMVLIRFFDQREVDNAKIANEVKRFVHSISVLFFEGRVWTAEGHTKVCLTYLENASHFVVNGDVRTIGGPRAVSRELRARVLKRMQAWAILAQEVARAEHPAFELVSCFSCFDLDEWPMQTPQELTRHGRTKCYSEQLGRLANAFDVDTPSLISEFFDLGDFAYARHMTKESSSNLDAWIWALASTESPAARRRHPAEHLQDVLAAYACMSSSDSIIEHDFSRVKYLLGEQRLHIKGNMESDLVMVLLSDPSTDKEVIQHAQDVWRELYAGTRVRSVEPRSDKGTRFDNSASYTFGRRSCIAPVK